MHVSDLSSEDFSYFGEILSRGREGRGNNAEKQGILREGGKGCCCYFL